MRLSIARLAAGVLRDRGGRGWASSRSRRLRPRPQRARGERRDRRRRPRLARWRRRAGLRPHGGGRASPRCSPSAGFSPHVRPARARLRLPRQRPARIRTRASTPRPTDAYWGLWWSDGQSGSWSYSPSGAGSLTVPEGGYVAFAWQSGSKAPPGVRRQHTPAPRHRPRHRPAPTSSVVAGAAVVTAGTAAGRATARRHAGSRAVLHPAAATSTSSRQRPRPSGSLSARRPGRTRRATAASTDGHADPGPVHDALPRRPRPAPRPRSAPRRHRTRARSRHRPGHGAARLGGPAGDPRAGAGRLGDLRQTAARPASP